MRNFVIYSNKGIMGAYSSLHGAHGAITNYINAWFPTGIVVIDSILLYRVFTEEEEEIRFWIIEIDVDTPMKYYTFD